MGGNPQAYGRRFPVATTTIQTTPPRDAGRAVLGRIGAGFAALARFFGDLAKARRAALEAERLMALPEPQLAKLGLKRDEIVAYAFRRHMSD
jgi:hypothetical protein